jgi:hypothetical protein
MKTKIHVSGQYIQRNNKVKSNRKKENINRNKSIVEKRKAKRRKLGLAPKEEVKPEVSGEVYLGTVLQIDREGEKEGAHEACIVDSNGNTVAKVVYDPSLEKGAKVWIETELEVRSIINKY